MRGAKLRGAHVPAVAILLAAAGCNGLLSTSTETAGASGRGGLLPPGLRARVTFERRRDAADPAAPARFEAAIEGARVRAATLALPDGSVRPFAADGGSTRYTVGESVPEESLLERFPNGTYTIEMTLESGGSRTLSIFVRGSLPDFPVVVDPTDGAIGVALDHRFAWEGPLGRYDVDLVDEATGERRAVADDLEGFEALPSTPLEPGTRYLLEVRAESGPPGELVEFESTAVGRFTTESGGL